MNRITLAWIKKLEFLKIVSALLTMIVSSLYKVASLVTNQCDTIAKDAKQASMIVSDQF